MTGGGALLKGLDQLLGEDTGLSIHVDDEPLSCVVRGAGMVLDDWEKYGGVLGR
jgi:rod shape-determining protein MreB